MKLIIAALALLLAGCQSVDITNEYPAWPEGITGAEAVQLAQSMPSTCIETLGGLPGGSRRACEV